MRQGVSRREFSHRSLAAFAGSLVLRDRAFSCSNYLFQDAGRSTAPNVTIIRATTRTLDINGKAAEAMGLLQPNGTQGMRCVADQLFNVRLDNELSVPTAIHWHGLHPPNNEDGVLGVTARRYRVGRAGYLQRFVSSSACRGYVQHQPVCCQWRRNHGTCARRDSGRHSDRSYILIAGELRRSADRQSCSAARWRIAASPAWCAGPPPERRSG